MRVHAPELAGQEAEDRELRDVTRQLAVAALAVALPVAAAVHAGRWLLVQLAL